MNRRKFLKHATQTAGIVAAAPVVSLSRTALAASDPKAKNTLVLITNWGGMDVLSPIQPLPGSADHKYLKEIRPNLICSDNKIEALNFNQKAQSFGLNSAMKDIANLFTEGSASIVLGTGLRSKVPAQNPNSRSHFSQSAMIEGATNGNIGKDGVLNRALSKVNSTSQVMKGLAISPQLPRILTGNVPGALNVGSLASIGFGADTAVAGSDPTWGSVLQNLYANGAFGALTLPLRALGFKTNELEIEGAKLARKETQKELGYTSSQFNGRLKQAADVIINGRDKAGNANVRVIVIPGLPGLDTHTGQVGNDAGPQGESGGLAKLLTDFSEGIAAFAADLKHANLWQNVTVMTVSEFGRSMNQNGNRGTDHGRGSACFLFGGNLNGAQFLHSGKPLQYQNEVDRDPNYPLTFQGRGSDLSVAFDVRRILAEVLNRHLGISKLSDLEAIFSDPNQPPDTLTPLGLIKAA